MSSSDIAVSVRGLSKAYSISRNEEKHNTLAETLMQRFSNPYARKAKEIFWALKDVEFDIKRGDVVGIIGRNGAGKSTFLKILSQITEPTKGEVRLFGRVGSLLEVGTGFHPELTGRENIYLNGAILGMSRAEINRQFEAIVDFSGVETFLDTPVKRYSSGMYVRLAFAVAAHLEPDILVLDEVLAVGDMQFQKKCLGKIDSVAKQGRTVILVSHNLAVVQQLTNQCALFVEGRLNSIGRTREVVETYARLLQDVHRDEYDVSNIAREFANLNFFIKFVNIKLKTAPVTTVSADESIQFDVGVLCNECVLNWRMSLTIFQSDGTPVGSCFSNNIVGSAKGTTQYYHMSISDHRLAPGKYYMALATGVGNYKDGHQDFDIITNVLHFEVMAPEGEGGTVAYWYHGWGATRLPDACAEAFG